ncbi:MAG TPA: NAD(P)H-binding protein, partial [Pseudonocardiaceae bacterium]
MRLAVFGATGGTGAQLIRQALRRGHRVTALVRRPEAMPVEDPHL